GGQSRIGFADQKQTRHRVGDKNRQSLQRLQENVRGVAFQLFIRAMRSGDELRRRAALNVLLKNSVRIVEKREDQDEPREVIRQLRVEAAVAREKAGHRAGLDGTHFIRQSAGLGQLRDVRITKDFEMRVRKLSAQRRENRQRQNEIADGAAADDEDFAAPS